MPGFFVTNVKSSICLNDKYPERCIADSIYLNSGHTFQRNTLNKFLNDKCFFEDEHFVFVLEGYVLNKLDLFKKYGATSIDELVKTLYTRNGHCFYDEFRGAFSGLIYNKSNGDFLVFTNHTGDAPVFYLQYDETFAFASEIQYLIDFSKEQGINLTFNESAAYQLLTFGFIATNETISNEINRLRGGTYLIIDKNRLTVHEYHRFHKNNTDLNEKTVSEIIEKIDCTFKEAVRLEWQKDEEYGYNHLCDLSGGLDSRMNLWVAHENKRHVTLLTYCKGNYLDELIAKQIACFWKDEILVKQLDDASFLFDIDDIVQLNGGTSLYSGITGGKRLLDSINLDTYGLEHTGMIGDVVLGSFFHSINKKKNNSITGMYSEKLKNRTPASVTEMLEDFGDRELFLLYSRGFHGAVNSHLIRRHFTEVASPFLNVDFLQYCLDIPLEYRINHNIYKKWILEKYPEAATFKWEKTNCKISSPQGYVLLKQVLRKGPGRVLRHFNSNYYSKEGMNPLDYWINSDASLNTFLNNYERQGYDIPGFDYPNALKEDMKALFSNGSANEKAMVLTLISSIKLYFGECNDFAKRQH